MRKQFYQTALGNCYGLKLQSADCSLKKLLCHLLQFSAHFRFLFRVDHGKLQLLSETQLRDINRSR